MFCHHHLMRVAGFGVTLALLPLLAQDPPSPDAPAAPTGMPAGMAGGARATTGPPEPRPYEKVVTKEFQTDDGVFKVHRNRDRVLFEIPKKELDQQFLWVSQIRSTTLGVGYGGQALGNRVVRWELRDRRILLRSVNYDVVADSREPIAAAVKNANFDPIIMSFNVEALTKEGDPVIDVTRLFTSDVPEFSARARLRARAMDPSRSFVDRVVSFPINIETDTIHTYTTPVDAPTGMPQAPTNPFLGAGMRPGSGTVAVHYSMVKLPEKPMLPRLFDERVGYFTVSKMDYSRPEPKAMRRTFITKWRLEKRNPSAAISEPVKPIVYYIDPATPKKYVPWVKKGIEDWQPAFEEAGFRKAIIAKEAPTKQEDPDWSAEDARYSVIRWLPSNIENASGPHVHDPRTGEILESDIQFYHNVQNLAANWYFVQSSPLDPKAQKLPLSEDLMGRLIEYVVAHEVGHTLGFQHNMKASSTYTLEKVRDKEWVKTMGHTPTLMDYSRYNYVAQPEDKIDPADLIPGIGPYDKFATMWGYKAIPGAETPDDEKATLNQWLQVQVDKPYLRFSTAGSNGSDPGELTEAVGDADAVKATGLGLKNLERVSGYLLPATEKTGENWDQLREIYGRVLGQWTLEMNHVVAIVGGSQTQQVHGGQKGLRFQPIPRERQAEAVAFLNDNAFRVPKWVLNPEVLRRIEPDGALARFRNTHQILLTNLLSPTRFNRLSEQDAMSQGQAYAPSQFVSDLRKGVYSELSSGQVKVDPFRRNTQRAFLDVVNDRLNGRGPALASEEQRALLRSELRALSSDTKLASTRATDRATRAHLEDVRDQIERILDPKFATPAPAATSGLGMGRPSIESMFDLFCWREEWPTEPDQQQ